MISAITGSLAPVSLAVVTLLYVQRRARVYRNRQEQALRESEDRYRDLVENSQDLICTHDLEGRLLSVNAAASRLTGYSVDDLMRMSMTDLLVPAARHLFGAYLAEIRASGRASGRLQIRTAGGETRVWEYRNTLRTEGVQFPVVRGLAHDITERARTEEEHMLFRTLLDRSSDAIEVLDPATGRFLDVNEKGYLSLGYTREEFLALTVFDVDPRLDQASWAATGIELRQAGTLLWEGFHRRKDGSEFPVEVNLKYVRLDRVYLVAVVRDVTERKQAELVLRLQSAALNTAADAILITERNGTIAWVNPAFSALTGYTAEESIGKNPRQLVKSGVQDRAFYKSMWDTIVAGHVWSGELTNRRKDGSQYAEEQTITPVRDSGGAITHFIAIKRDITERHKLEAQFLQSQKMETVGQLAGGIAHDFNNLLTVISGSAGLGLERLAADDPLREEFENIQRAGDRAAALTRQLLAFSRKQIMKPEVLDLQSLVDNLRGMLQRLIGEHIELVVPSARVLGSVRADPSQIEQVILNLAVNARDAMPSGGTLTIQARDVVLDGAFAGTHPSVSVGPHVMLAVSDTGIGMDAATCARIFEPFFTTKALGKGTGLGLAMVYGIVKQSGGSIWVDSVPGEGTTFTVYLPRLDEPAAAGRGVRADHLSRGTETILVVEDEDALRRVAARILRSAGYTVLAARDGTAAIQALDRHEGPVHLMVSDVVLPGISGPEVAKRCTNTRPDMKVLFTSGYTDDALLRLGVINGIANFLDKPYSLEELTGKVREVLDGQLEILA